MTATINESVDQMIAALRSPSGRDRRMADAAYRAKMKAVSERLIQPAFRGDRYARLDLNEAMSTSDFPILFGDVLGRSLQRRYAQRPSIWQQFAARRTVPDFRAVKLIDLLGGGGILPDVAELAPYTRRALSETEIELKTGKTGAALAWSWEAGVNDDLSAFADAPNRLSRAAVNTEDHKVTSAIATATGPAAWIGTPATTPLTRENLEEALQTITNQVDEDGNPIIIDTPRLVVPQSLSLTAKQIVETVTVKTTVSGVEAEVRGNSLSSTPQIVVNPWLTAINKHAKAPDTWYLLAGPDSERPAVFGVFLQGHEAPDLRQRADTGVRPGGGSIDPSEGDFEHDAVEYRIRHVVAGARGFDEVAFVSVGS
jgi:hypothetical protein